MSFVDGFFLFMTGSKREWGIETVKRKIKPKSSLFLCRENGGKKKEREYYIVCVPTTTLVK